MKKPLQFSLFSIGSIFLLLLVINFDSSSIESSVEPKANTLSSQISKEEANEMIKNAALSMITPHLQESLKRSIEAAKINPEDFVGFPATCFAPDTDPAVVEEFYRKRTALANSLGLPDSRFNLGSRWGTTASDGGGLGQGDITTLTWSYVADGTVIENGCGVTGESTDNSDFIAFFNGIYGGPTVAGDYTTAPWHNVFITMFDSWSAASGLIFVYEPNDDGTPVASFTGGQGILGTRGDFRISGHRLDGNSGVLACNYFPNIGDMIIDTDDNYYSNNPGNGTTNVLTHEIGHGLGIQHVCPVNTTKLMEPFITTAFLGPQEDDILATNRHYGDPDGVNDTSGTAVSLGNNANPTSYDRTQRSIDDNGDVDYFSFTVSESTLLSATLAPTGTTYLDGVQNGDGSCSAGTAFNALTISDLMFEVLGIDGVSVIATANANGAGANENLLAVGLPIAGTYYVRVMQQGTPIDNVQMYDLSVSLEAGSVSDNDVAATAIIAPTELETGLTSTEQLQITLSNLGALAQTSIPYQVKVNDVVVATETYNTSLASGNSVTINVPTLVDLSAFDFYDICVETQLPGDENTANDEFCQTTLHLNCIPATTTPGNTACSQDGIKQFVLGTINVDDGGSGCNTDAGAGIPVGYSNRTEFVTDLDRRAGFNVHTLQASTLWNNERIKVWIDFNDNGLFTDAGEEVLNTLFTITDGTLEDFSITVPTGTTLGNKLLRARAFDAAEDPSTTGPCDDIAYGETQDYVVTIIDPTPACSGTSITWDGTDWIGGVAPGMTDTAVIDGTYDTASDGDIDVCELVINTGRILTVDANTYVRAENDITVNGSLIVQPGGSVVQTEDAAVVTNNGTINVNVVTPTLASRDFMIMGSPMTAETRSGVFTDAFLVLNFNPDDFIANTAVPAGGTNWADDNGDFYSTHTGAINPGEGYVVRPQTGYGAPGGIFNMTYELGTMNNGVVTYSNFNNNPTPANNTPNVVANPYPSAILADDFMTVNSLTALYFWEHITPPGTGLPGSNLRFDMDDISIRNMGMGMPSANGGAAPTNFISTGQGFGVRTANAAPGVNGTITFNNSMRSTTGNNTLRRPAPSLTETITLEVRNTTTGVGGFTGVAFTDNATEQYDEGYDTNRLATIVSLFSHLPNGGEELGIQSREAFDTTITIPLGFETQIEKVVDYKISISDLEGVNIENATVYLMDHQTNQLSNLSQDSYSFSSTAGRYDSRFTLYFEEQIVLGDQDLALEAITVFPNPTESLLNVVSPTSNITSIEVYDVRGRQLQTIAGTNQTNYSLDLSSYDTAIYFVKIATEQGAITKRIVKQ